MMIRTLALATALACGFGPLAEARQKTPAQKVKVKKAKPRKVKPPKAPKRPKVKHPKHA